MLRAQLAIIVCYFVTFTLFWAPSRLLAQRLGRLTGSTRPNSGGPDAMADLWTLALGASLGYLTFWIYLLDSRVGLVWAGLLTGVAALTVAWRYGSNWARWFDDFSMPVRFAFVLGVFYLFVAMMHGGVHTSPTSYVRGGYLDPPGFSPWLAGHSGDDMIPLKFASAVANRLPLRGMMIDFPGVWQYSDRPPVQTGALLAFWPLTYVVGPATLGWALGTVLQMQWVVGLAAVATTLGFGRARTGFTLLLAAGSGIVYHNCTFVWPKFLAAALVLTAATPLLEAWRARRRPAPDEVVLAAAAAALAMLAHGTSGFSLLPMALLCLVCRRFWSWRVWLPAAATVLLLYLPWMAYQKFVDPPGDHCAKVVFASQWDANDDRPLWQTVREAYSNKTLGSWLAERETGFSKLCGDRKADRDAAKCVETMVRRWRGESAATPQFEMYWFTCAPPGPTFKCDLGTLAATLRHDQFDHLCRALGVLNIGWLILLWQILRSRFAVLRRRGLGLLLLFAATSALVWVLLTVNPDLLIVRNASYALLLALFMILGLAVYRVPRPARATILLLHIAANILLWVVLMPSERAGLAIRPEWAMVVCAVVALAGVIACVRSRTLGYAAWPLPVTQHEERKRLALASVLLLAFTLLVGLAAVARWSPLRHLNRKDYFAHLHCAQGGVTASATANVAGLDMLFDGVTTSVSNYAGWLLGMPLELHFATPPRLREIRLHLFDLDDRYYRFRVDGKVAGQWVSLLDRSQQAARGVAIIPCGPRPIEAIRIVGLYNSEQERNPLNRMMHIKELEFVPREAD